MTEKFKTIVKPSMEDVLLEHIRNHKLFKMFCESLGDVASVKDIKFQFSYEPKHQKDRPEFYTDSDGTKCYGIPQGTVKMDLPEETKDKLYGLAVETKEDKKRK
jgi:hypothetical protein